MNGSQEVGSCCITTLLHSQLIFHSDGRRLVTTFASFPPLSVSRALPDLPLKIVEKGLAKLLIQHLTAVAFAPHCYCLCSITPSLLWEISAQSSFFSRHSLSSQLAHVFSTNPPVPYDLQQIAPPVHRAGSPDICSDPSRRGLWLAVSCDTPFPLSSSHRSIWLLQRRRLRPRPTEGGAHLSLLTYPQA